MSIRHQKNGTYVTTLRDFGGLDLTDDRADTVPRFSRLENLWRDYQAGDGSALESFPGFRILSTLPGTIHGIWQWFTDDCHYLLVHAGTSLYIGNYADTDGSALTGQFSLVRESDAALADTRSIGFAFGESFYILDSEQYFAMQKDKWGWYLSPVVDLYDPITYSDGAPYEQRNVLSTLVKNRYRITDPSAFPCESRGLRYRILSTTAYTCEVSGRNADIQDERLYIPLNTVINGIPYRVVRVGNAAFRGNSYIREVFVAEGVEEVGYEAFALCSSLDRVFLPDSLRLIGARAFRACTSLSALIIGTELATIEADILKDCRNFCIFYHGDSDSFEQIKINATNAELFAAELDFLSNPAVVLYRFPLYEDIASIVSMTIDGVTVSSGIGQIRHYMPDYTLDGRIGGVVLYAADNNPLFEKEVIITLRLNDPPAHAIAGETDFAAGSGYDGTTHAAMARCTMAAVYDGRVFFSGNPDLPSTVFYTARDLSGKMNPAYVGCYNYFLCGEAGAPVTALLPTGAYLAVLCGDAAGGGDITYYHGSDTDRDLVPRIYVATDRVRGRGCAGPAALFRDDPVFLSQDGLEAISREALNTERSLKHRSTLVDAALTVRDPKDALHAVWNGYLVLLYPDGEAYLADSRRTATTACGSEYEWYHLSNICGHTNDIPVYRYADSYRDAEPDTVVWYGKTTELRLHPDADALPLGADYESYPDIFPQIYSVTTSEGEELAYTIEGPLTDPQLFLLRRTEEFTGGVFSPPTSLAAIGDKLFIGFENGSFAVVNTDRRGIMNAQQALAYTPEVYARQWGRLINPEWYSYGGHRYLAGLSTLPDDCNVSNYTKGTLRGTTVLEMKGNVGGGFSVEVRLWRASGPEAKEVLHAEQSGIDFTSFDFGSINFGACENCVITLNERSRRYLKKQYCLFSDAYARPFGLHSITYTWRVEGKVKNL